MIALIVLSLGLIGYIPTLGPGDTVPALPLVDQNDRAFSFADFRDDIVIVSFVYTSCRDEAECPLVAAKLARIQAAIGTQPIRLVALTLDPRNDTPANMRAFGAKYGADARVWKLATGAPAVIDELIARFGITPVRTSGTLVHDESVVVLDRGGRIARMIPGNGWTPTDVLALARTVAGAPVDWPTATRLWLATAAERCGVGGGAFSMGSALAVLLVSSGAIGFALIRMFSGRS